NLAARLSAFARVGPFDETLVTSEDFDWILRARAAGLATAFVPDAVVEHLQVRPDRSAVLAHAAWYGRHFHAFRRKHPGSLDRGPTWRSRALFSLTAPLKARRKARAIFSQHPVLAPARFTLPAVEEFWRAWYRAVAEAWP